MDYTNVINIIALLVAPIIAVIVGQFLQEKAQKRADKMQVFKTLMMTRGLSRDYQMVAVLNTIEVVFADDKKVVDQWKKYHDSLCADFSDEFAAKKSNDERIKLLEEMAKALKYKNIDWTTLQNPYIPNGMVDSMNLEHSLKNNQNEVWKTIQALISAGISGDNVGGGQNDEKEIIDK